jgi:hypothetical protein
MAVLAAAFLFPAHHASASTIALTFNGFINVSDDPSLIAPGTPYSGVLSYDTSDAVLFSAPSQGSTGYAFGPSDFLTFTVGGFQISSSGTGNGQLTVDPMLGNFFPYSATIPPRTFLALLRVSLLSKSIMCRA